MIIEVKARRYYGGSMAGVETRPVWATEPGTHPDRVTHQVPATGPGINVTWYSWTYGPPRSPFGHLELPIRFPETPL